MFRHIFVLFFTVITCLNLTSCSQKEIWTEPETKTMTEEGKKIWIKNSELMYQYGNKLIFTAVEQNGKVSMAANSRKAYTETFKNLILNDEPKLKKQQDKILLMIEKAPGKYEVVISGELSDEVNSLWENIRKKLDFHGISYKN